MATRTVEVSKKALETACSKLLSYEEERISDFDRRVAELKENFCKKTTETRMFGFFGPMNSPAIAEASWKIAWNRKDINDSASVLDSLFSILAPHTFDTNNKIKTLKKEQASMDSDRSRSIAWRLQKLAMATHGPVLRITHDDFEVVAYFIDGMS